MNDVFRNVVVEVVVNLRILRVLESEVGSQWLSPRRKNFLGVH